MSTNNISTVIDNIIVNSIKNYDKSYNCPNNAFEELLSFGELVDRLSIINFKLYKLKDEVMDRLQDKEFGAWAAIEDVKLVRERARLKRCIDEKLISRISSVVAGNGSSDFIPEVKKYGTL